VIALLVFTLAGLASGVYVVRTHPSEAADDKLATILVTTFVGFLLGWLVCLTAGFFELARTLH
jgi:hypothetical protein